MRLNTRFESKRLENGETLVEAQTRCRKQLSMSLENWSATQEKRVKGLVSAQPSTGFVGCANNTFSPFLIIHYQSSYSLSFLSHQLKHWDILG